MRIRPCIDIHNGKVKQIVGGTLHDRTDREDSAATENFATDLGAGYYAEIYREMGLSGGHIILLNSVKEREAYQKDLEQAYDALSAFRAECRRGAGSRLRQPAVFLTPARPMSL